MRRLDLAFVVLVAGATLVGGVSAASFGSDLRTVDVITVVDDQIGTAVLDVGLADGDLGVVVRISNPTRVPLELRGTFVRVFGSQGTDQLVFGAGRRVDDGSTTIPPRGTLTARYQVGVSPEQEDPLREAIDAGEVRLTVVHSLSLRGRSFEISRSNLDVTDAGGR